MLIVRLIVKSLVIEILKIKKKFFFKNLLKYFYYHYLLYISFINEITSNDYLTIEINTRNIFCSNNPRVESRPRIEIKWNKVNIYTCLYIN